MPSECLPASYGPGAGYCVRDYRGCVVLRVTANLGCAPRGRIGCTFTTCSCSYLCACASTLQPVGLLVCYVVLRVWLEPVGPSPKANAFPTPCPSCVCACLRAFSLANWTLCCQHREDRDFRVHAGGHIRRHNILARTFCARTQGEPPPPPPPLPPRVTCGGKSRHACV